MGVTPAALAQLVSLILQTAPTASASILTRYQRVASVGIVWGSVRMVQCALQTLAPRVQLLQLLQLTQLSLVTQLSPVTQLFLVTQLSLEPQLSQRIVLQQMLYASLKL